MVAADPGMGDVESLTFNISDVSQNAYYQSPESKKYVKVCETEDSSRKCTPFVHILRHALMQALTQTYQREFHSGYLL
jgi:hypothetical protein